MKKELAIYFDYVCPYCYRGISDLYGLLADVPGISLNWIPCEAHPRPEPARVHSDLASQAMIAARAYGGNVKKFNQDIFTAHFVSGKRIDDIEILVDIAGACGADREKTALALREKRYQQEVLANNELVWYTKRLEAVPCYECGRRRLASQEDVMIPKQQLKSFIDSLHS